jgi:hypothetical protein
MGLTNILSVILLCFLLSDATALFGIWSNSPFDDPSVARVSISAAPIMPLCTGQIGKSIGTLNSTTALYPGPATVDGNGNAYFLAYNMSLFSKGTVFFTFIAQFPAHGGVVLSPAVFKSFFDGPSILVRHEPLGIFADPMTGNLWTYSRRISSKNVTSVEIGKVDFRSGKYEVNASIVNASGTVTSQLLSQGVGSLAVEQRLLTVAYLDDAQRCHLFQLSLDSQKQPVDLIVAPVFQTLVYGKGVYWGLATDLSQNGWSIYSVDPLSLAINVVRVNLGSVAPATLSLPLGGVVSFFDNTFAMLFNDAGAPLFLLDTQTLNATCYLALNAPQHMLAISLFYR